MCALPIVPGQSHLGGRGCEPQYSCQPCFNQQGNCRRETQPCDNFIDGLRLMITSVLSCFLFFFSPGATLWLAQGYEADTGSATALAASVN